MPVERASAGIRALRSQRYVPGRFERLRVAGRGVVEPGKPDAADGNVRSAMNRRPRRQRHRLPGRHDPVVRERVEAHGVGQQGRTLELPLLGRQADIDLPPRPIGQSDIGETRAQVAHRLEAGHRRLAGAGHPRGLEPLERLARVMRQPCQRARQLGRRTRAGEAREPGDRRIHAVEQGRLVRLLLPRNGRLDESVAPAGRAGRQRHQLGRALTLVHAARAAPDLRVRGAEQRVVAAQIHRGQVRVRRRPEAEPRRAGAHAERKAGAVVELLCLPGRQSRGDLVGETVGIGRGVPGLVGEHRRRLVMLAAAASPRGQGGNDVGTDGADHPDEVAEDLFASPPLEGLLDAERVPEVHGAGEVLLGAVQAVRGVQLLGSQHRQRVEELGTDLVLAAVAARGRQQDRPVPLAFRQLRQQRVVLVVRVGGDHHEDAGAVELA